MSPSDPVFADGLEPPSEKIREFAVDWISRRDAGLSSADELEFQTWLAADPHHAAAIDALEPTWSAINRSRYAGRGEDLRWQVATRVARKKRRLYAMAIPGLGLAAVIVTALLWWSSTVSEVSVPTVALRPDQQLLPDGSTVELNFGTEIAVAFTPDKRNVRLLRGEALFQVAKDNTRPFVVTAGNIAVCAVGTAFTVRVDPHQVNVVVTEGRVAVDQNSMARPAAFPPEPASSAHGADPEISLEPVLVSAGRRVVFPALALGQRPVAELISPQDVAAALAWRNRRVEFNGTPLSEAVEVFNRANRLQLSVANGAMGELRISGVYWTDNPEAFSRVVEESLGIKAVQLSDERIMLQN